MWSPGKSRTTTPSPSRLSAAPIHVAGVRETLIDLADPEDLRALGRIFTKIIERTGGAE